MNCEQMTALLSAYVDGELTAQEELQVRNHLAQCPECRALYEQLQTLHTSFSDLEEIPAPEHFAQSVMNRIKAEEKPKVIPLFKRPQMRAVMGMAACAVLCIGFGSVALTGGYGSSKSASAPGAAAPESAAYDAAQTAGGAMEARIEAPMEAPAAEYAAPMEPPCAPAPEAVMAEPEVELKQDGSVLTPAGTVADNTAVEPEELLGEMVLTELPKDLEAVTGPLEWEERAEDGALCALLTPNQGEKVMELALKQDISLAVSEPAGGEPQLWRLILLP